jgi:hypothetical protein
MSKIRTYASICVYHNKMNADEMIDVLEYEPSRSKVNLKNENTLCVYSTRDELDSTDLTDHLTFLFESLEDLYGKICKDNHHGFESSVSVFWESPSIGGGGPRLNSEHLKFLGDLGIDVWFDFWGTI